MCVIFFKFDPRPASKNAYRLILAANRDEFFLRPSKPADYYGFNGEILCGMDLSPNKEGGTWLGVSKTGKLGAITNYMETKCNALAKGRGHLVSDYLMDKELDSFSYLKTLSKDAHMYNGYNLLTAEFNAKEDRMCYYGNRGSPQPISLSPGIYGLGNSLLETPWMKVEHGQRLFTSVVEQHSQPSNEASLVKGLLDVLKNDEQFQDPAVIWPNFNNGGDSPVHEPMTSVFMRPDRGYGTRTNTVVLIDAAGSVTFVERTMLNSDPIEWTSSTFHFQLLS